MLRLVIEAELENDMNTPLTAMPLSLFPIYLSLTATTFDPTSSSSNIIKTIENRFPDASSTPRIIEAAQEVARAKGGELHNISALTGGMVAQEVIKIITKQYIPIDNTCIFDGITSRTQVLRI
jgi:amyloid beta precursor protein binding protein 1